MKHTVFLVPGDTLDISVQNSDITVSVGVDEAGVKGKISTPEHRRGPGCRYEQHFSSTFERENVDKKDVAEVK